MIKKKEYISNVKIWYNELKIWIQWYTMVSKCIFNKDIEGNLAERGKIHVYKCFPIQSFRSRFYFSLNTVNLGVCCHIAYATQSALISKKGNFWK